MYSIMKPDWSRDVIHASNNSSKKKKNKFINIVQQLCINNIYLLEKKLIWLKIFTY